MNAPPCYVLRTVPVLVHVTGVLSPDVFLLIAWFFPCSLLNSVLFHFFLTRILHVLTLPSTANMSQEQVFLNMLMYSLYF